MRAAGSVRSQGQVMQPRLSARARGVRATRTTRAPAAREQRRRRGADAARGTGDDGELSREGAHSRPWRVRQAQELVAGALVVAEDAAQARS